MAAEKGKSHRKKKAGVKAQKRKEAEQKKKGVLEDAKAQKAHNPKAFSFQSANKARAQHARTAEREQRRLHAPMLDPSASEPPPFVVLVQGPPQVGKSTLIRCLVKHYSRQTLGDVNGPITVVAGKKRRISFVECPPDLNGMLDAAKFADLVLLVIDGSFGFEMETFEFLNLLQVHGFPKVMGVLTHLDGFKDQTQLKKTKKKLKARFWTEIYDGAKLFYLSGIQHGKYLKREVLNLARFISVMKTRPLAWRVAHPYVLADRFEDLTPQELVRTNPICDRDVVLYGWLRGTNMRLNDRIHWAGVGDFTVQELDALPDPCPLPGSGRKKGLNDKERLIYAPMSDLGGLLYDKDAVYIDIPHWKVQYSTANGPAALTDGNAQGEGGAAPTPATDGEAMVRGLQAAPRAVDEALAASSIKLFQSGKPISAIGQEDTDMSDEDDDEADQETDKDEMSDEDENGDDADGDEWSSDEDVEKQPGSNRQARPMPTAKEVVSENGRVRRAALFGEDAVAVEDGQEGGSSDDDDDQLMEANGNGYGPGVDDDDDDEHDDTAADSDDSEGLGAAARWKSGLGLSAAGGQQALGNRDLAAWVYGTPATAQAGDAAHQGAGNDDENSDDDDDDEVFVLRSHKTAAAPPSDLQAYDALDTSRQLPTFSHGPMTTTALHTNAEAAMALRGRFVTGDWEAGKARASARPEQGDDEDEGGEGDDNDDEVYGDFEDMETGEKFVGDGVDAVTAAAQKAIADAAAAEMKEAKAAKKAAFDKQYDNKKSGGMGDESDAEEEPVAKSGEPGKPGDPKEQTFYDAVKADMAARQARSKAALDALPAATRLAMEGFRPGVYLRIRLSGVPCELVDHLDPTRPLLLGGLGQIEDKMGVMKLRMKRHRWFPKLLKTRDPLVFSVGWRRFQALPVYCLEDHNRRLRMLKYTPEHMHCIAAVFGPLAPQNTGVVAIQSLAHNTKGWRVSATGVVLELDAEIRVVKKLKLVGTPAHISRHTAFIQGMFTSQLEASRFEGASVRSVSGIRGTIKKAIKPGGTLKMKDGTVRVTFEDKLLMSDMVFLRSWVAVDIPRFVNPVTNMLEAPADIVRAPKPSKKHEKKQEETADKKDQEKQPKAATAANGTASAPAALLASKLISQPETQPMNVTEADDPAFIPTPKFHGAKSEYCFKKGDRGLGYYKDLGPLAVATKGHASAGLPGMPRNQGSHASQTSQTGNGWVAMRTVAALRREKGIGAPRDTDSLYRPIERAPRKFNPLHIPKALQAALPFKTKPKLEVARKPGAKKTLEQKRAVVMEPHERRAATLLQQLNAIRNEKAEKRRQQQARRNSERAKKQAVEDEWRGKLNKERRKERYRDQGQAEKRKELAAEGGGKFAAKKRRKVSNE